MPLWSTIERAHFHFDPPGIIICVNKFYGPILSWVILKVEIDAPAPIIPPSSIVFSTTSLYCTIAMHIIIVIIICTKLHAIVISKWVSRSNTGESTNSQWVLIVSTPHFKHIIVKVGSGLVLKFKVNSEFPLSSFSETTNGF